MATENNENNSNEPGQEPVKEITKESVIAELSSEDRYVNYFKSFNPDSVKHFIRSYAWRKEMWWKYGESSIKQNEREDMRWINAAWEHLKIIQQKKLFDAQCLWRAEKVTFAEIEICFDFEMWEKNVLHCPFIDPINDDDIQLYIEYMNQWNARNRSTYYYEWQDYDQLKESYNNNDADVAFPEWYDFCNGRRGTGVLMLLPDIRGKKEEFYCDIHRKIKQEEGREAHEKWEATREKRPSIDHYEEEQLDFFVKTFEDKQTQQYYKAFKRNSRHRDVESDILTMVSLMLKADEPVPIGAHYDFVEALREALNKYSTKKEAEFIPYAYEEYKLNRSMGLGASQDDLKAMEGYKFIRDNWFVNITNGRIANGEQGDLNF